jgi:GTP cyclohydrolase I
MSVDLFRDAIKATVKAQLHWVEPTTDMHLREGLQETPERVAKAFEHWFSGYDKNPADILKTFEDGSDNYDEMVVVKDIPVYSKCEHHMADIFGTATVAYIPDKRIVGLSKLSRLVDMYARRLQVQERLTTQVADALQEHLKPLGVGVQLRCRHMCMESRGICQQGHITITNALRGYFMDYREVRQEFMALAETRRTP